VELEKRLIAEGLEKHGRRMSAWQPCRAFSHEVVHFVRFAIGPDYTRNVPHTDHATGNSEGRRSEASANGRYIDVLVGRIWVGPA
jgi:hypothetical protein